MRNALLIVLLGAVTGCTIPGSPYRRIDQNAPAFKEAVAKKTQELEAKGRSPKKAAEIATRSVTSRFIETNKTALLQKIAPLTEAFALFEKPCGCWAYTATTSTRKNGTLVIEVIRFDPFQAEAGIWTLVSRDGREPTEKEQAAFRSQRLRRWKKNLKAQKSRGAEREYIQKAALRSELEIIPQTSTRPATLYVLNRDKIKTPVMTLPPVVDTFTVADHSPVLLSRSSTWSGPCSVGPLKIIHYSHSTDYLQIEPSLPPFVAQTTQRYRTSRFGVDSGDVEIKTVYSDYRRVKCYDDRFEVLVGPPEILNELN